MRANRKSPRKVFQVVLGSQTIKAFVAAPKEFRVLGIVRMGMEFGLLAKTVNGSYVRVNGSTVESLDYWAVESAIAFACQAGRGESYAATRMHREDVPFPTVVVRKRRRSAYEERADARALHLPVYAREFVDTRN